MTDERREPTAQEWATARAIRAEIEEYLPDLLGKDLHIIQSIVMTHLMALVGEPLIITPATAEANVLLRSFHHTSHIRLVQTCGACPEQYDAFHGDRKVGYLRLRHGHFTVSCPDTDGDIVYFADTRGDGCFADAQEKGIHLAKAKGAIADWLAENS